MRYFAPGESWDDDHQLLTRLLALRKAGLIGVLLAECGVYYVCEDALNPWGSKQRKSKEQLWEMVHALEASPARIEAQSEVRRFGKGSKLA